MLLPIDHFLGADESYKFQYNKLFASSFHPLLYLPLSPLNMPLFCDINLDTLIIQRISSDLFLFPSSWPFHSCLRLFFLPWATIPDPHIPFFFFCLLSLSVSLNNTIVSDVASFFQLLNMTVKIRYSVLVMEYGSPRFKSWLCHSLAT